MGKLAGRIGIALAVVLALAAAAELALRATGYGAPVLYVADPDYEYALAPNQSTHRLGARIRTNRFGMRSPDFDPAADVGERVLVLGDSVVAAGNWTDQDKLATTLLANEEARFVLNVSAGSWGPGNQLAYVQRRGLFGAKDAIIVWSSHDYSDNRVYNPPNRYDSPTRAPVLALGRLVDHYLLNGVERARAATSERTINPDAVYSESDARESAVALLRLLRNQGVRSCVMLHRATPELARESVAGLTEFDALAREGGARVVEIAPYFAAAMESGVQPYRDDIHLSDAGQALLAQAMRACLSP